MTHRSAETIDVFTHMDVGIENPVGHALRRTPLCNLAYLPSWYKASSDSSAGVKVKARSAMGAVVSGWHPMSRDWLVEAMHDEKTGRWFMNQEPQEIFSLAPPRSIRGG